MSLRNLKFRRRGSVLEPSPTKEKDASRLGPHEFIEWFHTQTVHRLSEADEKAILKNTISGIVFLEHGTKEFFVENGVGRGSCIMLATLRANILKKRTITDANLDTTTDDPSKRQHVAEGSGDTAKSDESKKQLQYDIDQLVSSDDFSSGRERAVAVKKRHDQILEHFQKNFSDIEDAKRQLSSPDTFLNIPFPYAGPALPDRFKPGTPDQSTFCYAGREDFPNILDSFLQTLQGSNVMDLWLYGPIGYGKSHLLAAVTYCLTALGLRVIYLPDCRVFTWMTFRYMKTAMFFAWADNPVVTKRILALQSLDDIQRFFRNCPSEIVFVIDQINALEKYEACQEASIANARNFLDECRGGYRTFFGTSANNLEFKTTRHQQRNEKAIHVYGGFTETELAAWWHRNDHIDMQGFTRAEVEDYTGKLPLLLEGCIEDGTLNFNTRELRTISRLARRFVTKIKETQSDTRWSSYQAYVRGCIEETAVEDDISEELIDHRFFYEINGIGKCACGLVRNTVTKKFISLGEELFTSRDILDTITAWINNPSVTGFFLERAALRSIATKGIGAVDLGGPIIQRVFDDFPDYDLKTPLVLHIPLAYNHPAVDAVLAQLNDEKKTMHLYPIQITVAGRHKNSEKAFFANWKKWCSGLYDYEVSATFLWIDTTEQYITKVVEEKNRTSRSGLHPQNPKYDSIHLPLSLIAPEAWARYQAAKRELDLTQD